MFTTSVQFLHLKRRLNLTQCMFQRSQNHMLLPREHVGNWQMALRPSCWCLHRAMGECEWFPAKLSLLWGTKKKKKEIHKVISNWSCNVILSSSAFLCRKVTTERMKLLSRGVVTGRSVVVPKEFCERVGKVETSPRQTTEKACQRENLHRSVWASSSASVQSRKEPQHLGGVRDSGRHQWIPECQQCRPNAGPAPP